MTHASPAPTTADLWTCAAAWLSSVARLFGDALAIARRWRMARADIAAAYKALALVESLARRLVFAQALTLKVRLRPGLHTRVRPLPRDPRITTIALDPWAFRRAMEEAPSLLRISVPHKLDGAPHTWPARFCVAQFARDKACETEGLQCSPRTPAKAVPRAFRPASLRITISRNRAARRASRAQRLNDWMMGPYTPGERMPDFDAPAPPRCDPHEALCTIALACRMEALGRVLAKPLRHARALARRLARHVAVTARIAQRLLARPRSDEDVAANAHIEAALPPDSS